MLADPKSGEVVRNFVGQGLEARGVDEVQINAFAVLDPRVDVSPVDLNDDVL